MTSLGLTFLLERDGRIVLNILISVFCLGECGCGMSKQKYRIAAASASSGDQEVHGGQNQKLNISLIWNIMQTKVFDAR